MKPLTKRLSMGCLLCFSVISTTSQAASSLFENPTGGWNGLTIGVTVDVGYRPTTGGSGAAPKMNSDSVGQLLADFDYMPGVVVSQSTTAMMTPDTGDVKDQATATASFSFTFGSGIAADSFRFDYETTTSAQNAMVDFGEGAGAEAADAFTKVTMTLSSSAPLVISSDPTILPWLKLPSIAALDDPTRESFNAVWQSPHRVGAFSPGDPGTTERIDLVSFGDSLNYTATYEVVTPFGEDPTHSYSISGTAFVPEPSTALLLLMSFAAYSLRRKRD